MNQQFNDWVFTSGFAMAFPPGANHTVFQCIRCGTAKAKGTPICGECRTQYERWLRTTGKEGIVEQRVEKGEIYSVGKPVTILARPEHIG
jgi:hypothetical protein